MKHDSLPPEVLDVAGAITEAGGRALLVGGHVRDWIFSESDRPVASAVEFNDIDIEVYGLQLARLEEVLGFSGEREVFSVGRSFGVFKVKGVFSD